MTIPFFPLAKAIDAIPIVQSSTDRDTKYPQVFVLGGPPPVQVTQRVQNLGTGVIERWDGLEWLSPDPAFAISTSGSGGGGTGTTTFPLAGQPGVLGTGYFAVVDSTAHRNALNPLAFTIIENLQTGNIELWNGTSWNVLLAGIAGAGTQPPSGTTGAYAAGRSSVPWFNVSTYGATGNGQNDDTTAIQKAINDATALTTGGVVFFPPGAYIVAGTLTWSPKVSFYAVPGSAAIVPFASGGSAFTSPTGGMAGACYAYGLIFDATLGSSASTAANGVVISAMAAGATVVFDACSFNLTQAPGTGSAIGAVGANPGITVRNSTVVASKGAGFITGGPLINCTVQSATGGVALSGSGQMTGNTIVTGTGTAAITVLGNRTNVSGNTIQLWNGHGVALGTTGLQELRITNNEIGAIQGGASNAINISDSTFGRNLVIANNTVDNTAGSCIYVSAAGCGGITIAGNNTHVANAGGATLPSTGSNASIEVQAGVNVSVVGNTHWFDTGSGDQAKWQVYLGSQAINVSVVGNTGFINGGLVTVVQQVGVFGAKCVEQAANILSLNAHTANPLVTGTVSNTGVTAPIMVGASVTITASTSYAGYVPVTNVENVTSGGFNQLPQVIRVNATSGNVTVTLPVANTCVGANLMIKRTDSSGNTVTVAQATSPADTIDGSTSNKTIAALGVLRLYASGPSSGAANWDTV